MAMGTGIMARAAPGPGGHAFAALAPQEDRVVVAHDAGERDQHGHHGFVEEYRASTTGTTPFSRSATRTARPSFDPQDPEGIGGAGIAAAVLADVDPLEELARGTRWATGTPPDSRARLGRPRSVLSPCHEYRSSLPSKSITRGIPQRP